MSYRIGRRAFLVGSCATGMLTSTAVRAFALPAEPTCALHNDQPYLDVSGTARAYRPPAGLRGAQPLAVLDETALRHAQYYV